MLIDLLTGKFKSPIEVIVYLFAMAFIIFCTMPIHEYAHALVATKLGDQTPRLSGRLTLNPAAHISPFGALMILLCGFGYAKPVNVNPRNFKDSKKGMALTAIAGPISNLIMALIFVLLCQIVFNIAPQEITLMLHGVQNTFLGSIYKFLLFAASVNVNLAVFNLLPIPPLDGSRILQLLIPNKYYYTVMQYERYIVLVVFALLFSGVLSKPLSYLAIKVMNFFFMITGFIF